MNKTIIMLTFLTIISCKNNTEKTNSASNNDSNQVVTKIPVVKNCNQSSAESAVISHLLKIGIIEYNSQAKCKSTKINDDCDYRVTVTFYLENLYSGDGTKDYEVSFNGNNYLVN